MPRLPQIRWAPNFWDLARVLIESGRHRGPRGRAFRELEYPVATHGIQIDGITTEYLDLGEGPPLVLLHGLASNLTAWVRNLEGLTRHHRIIALDLPGFGKSDKPARVCSMRAYAEHLDALMQALDAKAPIIVGHSMGAQIALTHALAHPGRARALVLTAPAGLETFTSLESRMLERLVTPGFTRNSSPAQVRLSIAQNFNAMPPEAQFMIEHRLAVIGGPDFEDYCVAVSRCVSAMLREPVFDRLGQIDVPTLVLFGERDRMIPNPVLHGGTARALAERVTPRLPRAQLVMVPRAGHMVHFERPDAWNAAVQGFIAGLPPRST